VLGIIGNINLRALNQLMILVQPAHIQRLFKHKMDAAERDFHRANIVRDHLMKSRKKFAPRKKNDAEPE